MHSASCPRLICLVFIALGSLSVLCVAETASPRRNAHYLAPPGPNERWEDWLEQIRAYRRRVRAELPNPEPGRTSPAFDDSVYRRDDFRWMSRNFVCGFLFVYDRAFWDPERQRYRVAELCEQSQRDFGGYDSVVLWHAYPRIGADARNQFDFFRDMPGGLDGLRDVVRQFHQRGIRVFLPYNPWDTGTQREKDSDDEALAHVVGALEADGIFLDTMVQSPAGLRQAVDVRRPGVAFEPEGHPSIAEMERCNGSWAQWLQPFPGIGVLHLKWIEPRHMQHQIRRWDSSHRDELAGAWLNGSGILVWENIFGTWNPWNAEDRATLRRMAPVLRQFAAVLSAGEWLPCYPTRSKQIVSSCWQDEKEGIRLWTLLNLGDRGREAVLQVDDRGEQFFDLWRGESVKPEQADGKLRVAVPVDHLSAVVGVRGEISPALHSLLETQRHQAQQPRPRGGDDLHVGARPVVEAQAPPPCADPAKPDTAQALRVDGGEHAFVVRHMRRECGCYPDPGTPRERWQHFLAGNPHDETLEHRLQATVEPGWIDSKPVTNGEFEQFIRAAGYKPACPDRFLTHWAGASCPAEIKDQPVVYIDLDDARAYAAWAGKRLPTEWEWQRAAQQHGNAFRWGEVHEWTESVRDDGHTRFVMLRGGSAYQAKGSIWYFPGGKQPIESHAKFILLYPGLDRCGTIGFRCVAPDAAPG